MSRFPFSRLREKVPEADEGMLVRANQERPHPALSRERERGKPQKISRALSCT